MKKYLMIIALFYSLIAAAQPPALPPNESWFEYFFDDFNTLNPQNWIVKNEFDHYGNEWIALDDNAYIENGNLVLKANDQTYNCITQILPWTHAYPSYDYTTAYITTKNILIHYGYFETRAKCPFFDSVNTAFWTTSASEQFIADYSSVNEIDIFENLGSLTGYNKSTTNVHLSYNNDDPNRYEETPITDYREYHVYGCEWTPSFISFFIDGVLTRVIPNPGVYDPVIIIFNIGFNLPTSSVLFPHYMYIDYFRFLGRDRIIENRIVNSGNSTDFASHSFSIAGNGGNYSITNNAIHELYATKFISINPGFEVTNGSEFIARVDDYKKNPNAKMNYNISKPNTIIQPLNNSANSTPSLISNEINEGIKILPNPSRGAFSIELATLIKNIELYNLTGVKIYENKSNTTINTTNFPAGIYILKVLDINENVYCEKISIE